MDTKLDKYFQPLNSPIADREYPKPFFDFDSENEANSVGAVHLRNFSFNQGTGGTITLGGTANGNGLMLIKNASGSTIVTADNEGITVSGGSISIENDSFQSVFDAKGIVSNSNNFITTQTTNASLNQVISGTTATDVTGSSVSIVLTRSTLMLFLMTTEAYLTESVGNTADGEVGLNIDSVYPFAVTRYRSGNNYNSSRTAFYIALLGSGTHPVKMQARLTTIYAGTPSTTLVDYSWSYVLFGT